MYAIKVKNLTKKYPIKRNFKDIFKNPFYREYLTALNNISFNVEENEVIGLIGLNGAGKTTMLKLFSSLLIPDEGSIEIFGYGINKNSEQIKKMIGLVNSEERSFYWRLNLKQNLEFFADLYGLDKYEKKNKVNQVLNFVDLYKNKNMRFDSLSTGMKQRMSIARGILNDPKILLLDEPTKGLDIKHAEEIIKLIKKISKNKTIVITSNNLDEISQLCKKIIIIHNGRIIKIGKFKNIKNVFKNSIK